MANIKPFAALRPKPDLAVRICELPYDVLSSNEAREAAAGNPFSFFRVSKPEIDLPAPADPHDASVYEKGRYNFSRFLSDGWLRQDSQACFYLYRQIMGGHQQTGLVAVADCEDYLRGTIRKHELTRPDKEDDRVRHIDALDAQTGPAFLAYRAVPEIDALVARRTAEMPAVDFVAPDRVQHTAWKLSDRADIEFIQAALQRVRLLYIADGHHRCAAAARVYQARRGAGNSRYFLAVSFPDNQLQILPYHRVLKDLNGHAPEALLARLAEVFAIQESGAAEPKARHELGLYFGGQWRTLRFHPRLVEGKEAIEALDVALLQQHVLGPVFGIEDPRTSQRIGFVGGVRGTGEIAGLVDRGDYACAFAMCPTSLRDLMTIADAGDVMPPKSTWFEPKLRDAMFCHLI